MRGADRSWFSWGQVWEWTASAFQPYPGFRPHPYRDYSAPWFGSRTVLRGACPATSAIVAHPRYRNFLNRIVVTCSRDFAAVPDWFCCF